MTIRWEDLTKFDAAFRGEILAAAERLCDRDWRDVPTVKPRARKATRATPAERYALVLLAREGDFGSQVRLGVDWCGMKPPD